MTVANPQGAQRILQQTAKYIAKEGWRHCKIATSCVAITPTALHRQTSSSSLRLRFGHCMASVLHSRQELLCPVFEGRGFEIAARSCLVTIRANHSYGDQRVSSNFFDVTLMPNGPGRLSITRETRAMGWRESQPTHFLLSSAASVKRLGPTSRTWSGTGRDAGPMQASWERLPAAYPAAISSRLQSVVLHGRHRGAAFGGRWRLPGGDNRPL
jgi:hypothetical protein